MINIFLSSMIDSRKRSIECDENNLMDIIEYMHKYIQIWLIKEKDKIK